MLSTQISPEIQCASYALELLSYGGLRSHVLGALIHGDKLTLRYYDRSAIIYSESLSITDEPLPFIRIISALGILGQQEHGFGEAVRPEIPVPMPDTRGIDYSLLVGRTLQLSPYPNAIRLGKAIFLSHGILGRGTCVFRASIEAWSSNAIPLNCACVVKISWPSKSRLSETKFLDLARNTARTLGPSADWVLQHLPTIYHTEDFVPEGDFPQSRLQAYYDIEEYEPRIRRTIVQEELFPIIEILTGSDLVSVFYGIAKGAITIG